LLTCVFQFGELLDMLLLAELTVSAPRLTPMPSHNTQTLTGNVSSL